MPETASWSLARDVGPRIRALRQARGWTPGWLAHEAMTLYRAPAASSPRVSTRWVLRIESGGGRVVDRPRIAAVADALGVPLSGLVGPLTDPDTEAALLGGFLAAGLSAVAALDALAALWVAETPTPSVE